MIHIPCGWWVDNEAREMIVEALKRVDVNGNFIIQCLLRQKYGDLTNEILASGQIANGKYVALFSESFAKKWK
ncbi:hypothetical protein PSJ60_08460 [Escherichia coli]|uniref:hypothetical protein n=1 Tax=Escherichia coli TaxID=562 RepID=UPI002358566E|nr:hypothetical protein [Escherichia coli]MDC9065053.1 hypothetical protein [Escherichia coli]